MRRGRMGRHADGDSDSDSSIGSGGRPVAGAVGWRKMPVASRSREKRGGARSRGHGALGCFRGLAATGRPNKTCYNHRLGRIKQCRDPTRRHTALRGRQATRATFLTQRVRSTSEPPLHSRQSAISAQLYASHGGEGSHTTNRRVGNEHAVAL